MERTLPKPGCVLKVGDGRGFIIEYRMRLPRLPRLYFRGKLRKLRRKTFERRLIVTAAHCLPKLPPAYPGAFFWEPSYKELLGRLDGSKNIPAECLFVDPVADIAILDCPDESLIEVMEEKDVDAYRALIDGAPALRIGQVRSGRGWVLTLDGHWVRTTLDVFSGFYGISLSISPTKPGMSGSPILNDVGRAVGVVSVGAQTRSSTGERKDLERQGPQPILTRNLPGWLLEQARP